MYATYTASVNASSAPCSSTPSMNERSDCTSAVTRLMIEPLALRWKNPGPRRSSLSNTRARSAGTRST